MLRRFAVFLLVFQSILFLAHYFLFRTLLSAWGPFDSSTRFALGLTLAILAASFLSASLLAFRYSATWVRIVYIIGAVWLGIFNYLFLASIAYWLLYAAAAILKIPVANPISALILFGSALAISLYGLINAAIPRVKHVTVRLNNLPRYWHNRTFALVSDLHLGHVRNRGFASRIVRIINQQKPEFAIIAGDLFDGTAIDAARATAPPVIFACLSVRSSPKAITKSFAIRARCSRPSAMRVCTFSTSKRLISTVCSSSAYPTATPRTPSTCVLSLLA